MPALALLVGPEHRLEVTEELGEAIGDEALRSRLGLGLLVLVIKARCDRMMGVVDLAHEVRDRELELTGRDATSLAGGHEAETRRQRLEDVRGLEEREAAHDDDGR